MKWKIEEEVAEGTTRVVTKFAWWPVKCNGYLPLKYWVWLERYEQVQEYVRVDFNYELGVGYTRIKRAWQKRTNMIRS